jgi:hypothetical protein
VAILHGNVFLMAKLRLGSDRPCAHGSVGISRHSFPAMVTERQGDCPRGLRTFDTTATASRKVDHRFEGVKVMLRHGVEQRFLPRVCVWRWLLGAMRSVPPALLRHCFGASPSPCGSAVICFHGPFGSRSPKTNRAPRTRSRSSGDFFWVPPRKLTLALGAGPTRMAAPSVP